MVGVHVLIGIGEAVITFLAVGSILAVRPDLVYGARPVLAQRELEIRHRLDGSAPHEAHQHQGASPLGVLLVALLLAGRRQPLRVQPARRADQGLRRTRASPAPRGHDATDGPLRRLRQGRRRRRLSAVAGVVGSSSCCAGGVTYAVRRRAPAATTSGPDVGAGHGHKLHFHGHSPVHRAPAHLKILALLGFMLRRGRHAAGLVRRLRGLPRR